jgi:hypothetical protein
MEVLIAWTRHRSFKVVIMSATLEDKKLSAFYNNAPIISVPGRLFPIQTRPNSKTIFTDIQSLVNENRNILVFQPGKREIEDTLQDIEDSELDVVALPLHADLKPEEQAACFALYDKPKIVVSTNIAQTSVTVPDIDAVIDSGLERRIELSNGVEGLYLRPISLASSKQREGRAGRTKPGIYIDHCEEENRPKFPTAEILRSRLDQTVLRLAEVGFKIEDLEFFHQPKKSEIKDARKALVKLGCMTENGHVTTIGHAIAKMPISPQFARMIIEADKRGVTGDIITIAAILESGELHRRDSRKWRSLTGNERQSDAIAQLNIFKKAESFVTEEDFEVNGVQEKTFRRAQEMRDHLLLALERKVSSFESTGNRLDILKSVVAGMVHHVYNNNYGELETLDEEPREICRDSVVSAGRWLVGLPFDLEIETRYGKKLIYLVSMITSIDPTWLIELAPHLVEKEDGDEIRYVPNKDICESLTVTLFNGNEICKEWSVDNSGDYVIADWLANLVLHKNADLTKNSYLNNIILENRKLIERCEDLNARNGTKIFKLYSKDELVEYFTARMNNASRISDVKNLEDLLLPIIDSDKENSVLINCPDTIKFMNRSIPVQYSKNAATIHLDWSLIEDSWKELQDISLANGKIVGIVLKMDNKNIHGKTVDILKKRIGDRLNEVAWEVSVKPKLTQPHSMDALQVPDIFEFNYGVCVFSGIPLIAYGVASIKQHKIEAVWYKIKEEAEKAFVAAKLEFSKLKSKMSDSATELENTGLWMSLKKMRKLFGYEIDLRLERHDLKTKSLPSKKALDEGFVTPVSRDASSFFLWNKEKIENLAKND